MGDTAITDVPHFGDVRYTEVYAGIDVDYYGRDGLLEYDWTVRPGADADAIAMRFRGVDGMVMDSAGNLRLQVNGGELVERAPVSYQIIGGVRREVAVAYDVRADGSVGFTVGAYDHSLALVIDPVLVYSTYLGGSGQENANSVAVDAAGNTYVTGETGSSDFFTVNPFDPELNQPNTSPSHLSFDAFVSKFDVNGVLVFSSYLGGGSSGSGPQRDTTGSSIAVDPAGHVWVGGNTQSLLFPTTATVPDVLTGGIAQAGGAFLTEFTADGSSILYSSVFGREDIFLDIAIDQAGKIYGAGGGIGLKFDPATNTVPYVTLLGGSTRARGIAVDELGQAYLTGFTSGGLLTKNALFPTYRSMDPGTNAGDGFVTKLYADGRIAFSTYLGGSNDDAAYDIAVDPSGGIYVVGQTDSDDLPGTGGLNPSRAGDVDGFLIKLANDGSSVLYGTYLGGTSRDVATAVGVDAQGRTYVAGTTYSLDLSAVRAHQPTFGGGPFFFDGSPLYPDGFAASIAADGGTFVYQTYVGGSNFDELSDVAVDSEGNASYVGVTHSPDLPTADPAQPRVLGFSDAFIVRLLAGDAGTITLHNAPFTATAGNEYKGVVAFFSTNGSETADQFSAIIDWGDGLSSAGTIAGDFHNGFQIFGSHLYADAGTHDVFVTLRDSRGRTVTATTTGAVGAGAEGRVHYHVAIDTTALAGTAGQLSFQFNPGAIPGSPDAEARITGLNLFGGVAGSSTIDGGASQASGSTFNLTPTAALNRVIDNVTLGTRIEFNLELVIPGPAQPDMSNFAEVFALQLLSANGLVPLLGGDASASLLRVSLSPDGSTQVRSSGAAVTVEAAGRATVAKAPIHLAIAPFSVQEEMEFNGRVATFTDGNPLESAGQFTARIDWGDGSLIDSGIVAGGGGSFTVSGTHIYRKAGSYALAVTLVEPDGVELTSSTGRAILAATPFNNDWGHSGNLFSVPPVSGDFNGDGILDVAVGGFSPVPTNAGRGVAILLGHGDGSFDLAGFQITDQSVLQLAVADFNHDGKLDVAAVISTFGSTVMELLPGNGDGTMQSPIRLTALQNPGAIAAADLNGDGNADLIYTESFAPAQYGNASSILKVALGHGDGTFAAPTATTIPFGIQTLSVADMDGDHVPDLILSASYFGPAATLSFLRGHGDGTFDEPMTLPSGPSLSFFNTSLPIQDFNGDGKLDVAAADGVNLYIYTGHGDGTFDAPVPIAAPKSYYVVAADFDGNGRPDLAVNDIGFGGNVNIPNNDLGGVRVFLNDGAGGFAAGVRYQGIYSPSNLLTGDFDGDGHLDIAASGRTAVSTAAISVLPGLGDGTFASAVRYASGLIVTDPNVPASLTNLVTGDVNSDGHADAVLVASDSAIVTEVGNGDGTFQSIESGHAGPSQSGARHPILTDIDNDGHLDLVTLTLTSETAAGVGIVFGRGDGTFPTSEVGYQSGGAAVAVSLADLRHNGRLDMVAVYQSFLGDRVVGVSLANADGIFEPTVYYATGVGGGVTASGTRSLDLGDLNGDGWLDIVVANERGTVSVLLGNGDGTFGAALNIVVGAFPFPATGISPEAARLGDFNGDGNLDLVVVGYAGTGLLLPGHGDGTFGAALPFTTNVTSRDLAVGDFNGDGKLDIVTAEESGELFSARQGVGGLSVLFGNGDGTFQAPVDYFAGLNPTSIALGDFNQDGRLDIAAANINNVMGGTVSILLGNTDGTFQNAVNFATTGLHPRQIAVGDLNGDGKLDLAVFNASNDTAILLGNGNGTFQAPVNYATPGDNGNGGPIALAIGDLNGDGRADLVAGRVVLFGNGTGTFPNQSLFIYLPPMGTDRDTSNLFAIAAGDLNADGNTDLVVSMLGTTVILFSNGKGSFLPPVQLDPPAALGLGNNSSYRVALADMDGDGYLDVITLHQEFVRGGGAVAVWHNNGHGVFSTPLVRHLAVPEFDLFGTGLDMTVGDLNGDGFIDVVVTDVGEQSRFVSTQDLDVLPGGASVLLGVGDGSLAELVRYSLPPRQAAQRVQLGDLNHDGRPDLVVLASPFGLSSVASAVAVFTNHGDGTFGAAQLYDDGGITAADLATADFNSDGAADILVPDSSHRDTVFSIIFAGAGPVLVTDAPVTVTATNMNPSAGIGFTATVATFTDADPLAKASDFTATINWGDGQSSSGSIDVNLLGGFEVTGAHTYATSGVFTTTVTVVETGEESQRGSATARVSDTDQALTANGLVFGAMATLPFTGMVATFTDGDPNGSIGDFSAVIHWGDGQTSAGVITSTVGGGFAVIGTHTYANPGTSPVEVDIADIGGSSTTANSTAQVAPHVNQAPVAIDDS